MWGNKFNVKSLQSILTSKLTILYLVNKFEIGNVQGQEFRPVVFY